jgi:geranylgeranyl pyrophosphate synthase
MTQLSTPLIKVVQQVDLALSGILREQAGLEPKLHAALQYALDGAGKRIRPLLCYAAAQSVNVQDQSWLCPALALEALHTYSLVHDDLPAMDNDQWRRGRPTVHIAYDEATAILVGDALQALAFDLLAHYPAGSVSAEQRLNWIQILSRAAGHTGMVDGQALDTAATGQVQTLAQLENMHQRKTGKLIQAAVLMGGGCSQSKPTSAMLTALTRYGAALGLAFQIMDDILDVTGSTESLGKDSGSDALNEKYTMVSLLGIDAATARLHSLHQEALSALVELPGDTQSLEELAQFVVARLK